MCTVAHRYRYSLTETNNAQVMTCMLLMMMSTSFICQRTHLTSSNLVMCAAMASSGPILRIDHVHMSYEVCGLSVVCSMLYVLHHHTIYPPSTDNQRHPLPVILRKLFQRERAKQLSHEPCRPIRCSGIPVTRHGIGVTCSRLAAACIFCLLRVAPPCCCCQQDQEKDVVGRFRPVSRS